jgi:hypothetical protein
MSAVTAPTEIESDHDIVIVGGGPAGGGGGGGGAALDSKQLLAAIDDVIRAYRDESQSEPEAT